MRPLNCSRFPTSGEISSNLRFMGSSEGATWMGPSTRPFTLSLDRLLTFCSTPEEGVTWASTQPWNNAPICRLNAKAVQVNNLKVQCGIFRDIWEEAVTSSSSILVCVSFGLNLPLLGVPVIYAVHTNLDTSSTFINAFIWSILRFYPCKNSKVSQILHTGLSRKFYLFI